MKTEYQHKTGLPCDCKPGSNATIAPSVRGTGQRIDFAKIRARRTETGDKATARPWQANQSEMEAHSPLVEIRTAPNGDYKVCDCGWQNAALIVRAVNEHDALLRVSEAAKELMPYLNSDLNAHNNWQHEITEMDSALAAFDKLRKSN